MFTNSLSRAVWLRPVWGLMVAVAYLATPPASSVAATVEISEFMASNTKTLADQDGEYSDWIELHNLSGNSVNLEGWFLTDSTNQLAKWRFPSVELAPDGYLVVFASGKDRATSGAQLHTSFNLNAEGEYLALVQSDGTTIASEFAPQFPVQYPDISFGLYQGEVRYFSTPTPGAANGPGVISFVADTKFDHNRGFYSSPFDLAIATETAGATIRYTTNGTPPSLTNGLVYANPIPITGTTVIRAAAFKDGFQPSNVDTHTYIFLEDVIRQSPTGQVPPGWPSTWGNNVRDYGMDPDVVNSPKYSATVKNDLQTIPSFSIVTDLKNLFDARTGIYANAGQHGINWERPTSLELIFSDGAKGFQIDCGIRIRGGYSRSSSNPKHAFRLFFRPDYGTPKLKYPMFGDAGADRFEGFDLRTFQNYSWSFEGDSRGIFLRDQFSRDCQLAMGQAATRGAYYHLYINGEYWGLYNTEERPEASYAETYFGGNKEDYDVIKVQTGPYTIYATDGNMNAWTRLYNLAKAGLATDAAYQKIQGNNADGTRNPAFENLLDIDNLIDYMLVILYTGNFDAPISKFLGNTNPNNWYGIRSRLGTAGFRFFSHDAEHTLIAQDGTPALNVNRTGPYSAGDSSVLYSNPQWLWQKLSANAEFRLRVADHIQRHFFNGGVLTPQACINRFLARKNEIDRAVVGESARWGDAKRSTPLTRDVEWIREVNNLLTNYFPFRSDVVLGQLKTKNLYPSVVAPSFNQFGGNVSPGFGLTMTALAGTVYYTGDGSDPRLPGGALAPTALAYQNTLTLTENVHINSRVLNGTNWSALNGAAFTLIQSFTDVLVTEIMYHPASTNATADSDQLEFLELKNVGAVERDLSGVHFTSGVTYTFPNGTKVPPGQFVVLVSDATTFADRYPGVRIDGVYQGRLSNSGEPLTLVHAAGAPLFSVAYSPKQPWPTMANGGGFSLVPVNPNLNSDPNDSVNWRPSSRPGGSPGTDDPPANIPSVWVNEILTHVDPPQLDAIELFNPQLEAVDISHWLLTDQRSQPAKFHIPAGTIIPAGGYVVFTSADFNPHPGVDPSFTLSSHGEEVYLYSADAAGNLTGFSDGFSFGAAANGVTFGRYTNSVGEIQHPPQQASTLGAPNAVPRVGPVVINEIYYHPLPGEQEFLELKNITSEAVNLFDPEHPQNTWKVNGIGFVFPPNLQIPGKGLLLVVGGDPGLFRSHYNVPASIPVLGPFPGALQANGELLQLLRPDSPDVDTNGLPYVPYVAVDEVRYRSQPPWPTNADGGGSSLERLNAAAYGNDPANWHDSGGAPSPGLENQGNRPPKVIAGPDRTYQSAVFPFVANLEGTASDDGLPKPPGALRTTWSQLSGPGPVSFDDVHQPRTAASFPGVGIYILRLEANDGELASQDEVTVGLERTPAAVTLLPRGSVWKYLDNGSDQGTAWRAPAFNDSAWASGRAQLGYGDGDEATVVGYGPDSANKYTTTYFRCAFAVTNAAFVKELTARLLRDDGAVVYLNGIEIFRSNMPENDITYKTVATAVVSGADETTNFYEQKVDPTLLREGTNVLAAEIHQSGGTSTDISFDFELKGMAFPANQAPQVDAGTNLTINLSDTAVLQGRVWDDGLPIPPGLVTNLWSLVSGPGTVAFASAQTLQTAAQFSAPGAYSLRLIAGDGQLTASADVTVTVVGDAFSTWKSRYFTAVELADLQISGEQADPDRDGLTNLQEFLAGTDPRDPNSGLKIESVQISGNTVFLRFVAVAGKSYTLQYRDSMDSAAWQKLQDIPAKPNVALIVISDTLPDQSTARFYRLVTPIVP